MRKMGLKVRVLYSIGFLLTFFEDRPRRSQLCHQASFSRIIAGNWVFVYCVKNNSATVLIDSSFEGPVVTAILNPRPTLRSSFYHPWLLLWPANVGPC